MSGQGNATIERLEREVEEKKQRVKSVEKAIAEKRGTNQATMLAVSLRNLKADLANAEAALEEARKNPPEDVPETPSAPRQEEKLTISDLEKQIEKQEATVRKIEATISAKKGSNQANMLAVSLKNARGDLANMRAMLEDMLAAEAEEDPDTSSVRKDIADRKVRLKELDRDYEDETDPVKRNNIEVSRRFLQMEINSLLIRLSEAERGIEAGSPESEIEDLKRDIDGRIRMIEHLREELDAVRKELAIANARLGKPEDKVMCDTTRVTVEAGRLKEMDNSIRTLGAENYELRRQLDELKKERDVMKRNIRELTVHCDNSDRQIIELQSRIRTLNAAAEKAARDRDAALIKIESLNLYIKDMRRAGMR
ncbi:hypothetical protein TALC_01036 [Thermoplasmatales archaeon BRNA1]|nr:hypothetical protein TALC_01036 [Thermoplasmatales archaeon BRNA1]